MTSRKEIEQFFSSRNDPLVVGVSDAATLLDVDETVVRRWCRDCDLHRVGPNFVLSAADVMELAAALEDDDVPEDENDPGDDEDDEDSADAEGDDEDDEDDEDDDESEE